MWLVQCYNDSSLRVIRKKKLTAFIKLLQELAWNIDPIRTAVCLYALLIYHEKAIL